MNEMKKNQIDINYSILNDKLSNIRPITELTNNFFKKYSIIKMNNSIGKVGYNDKKTEFRKTVIIHIENGIDLSVDLTDLYYHLTDLTDSISVKIETVIETITEYC